jgi:small subunit ribosomal protein S12
MSTFNQLLKNKKHKRQKKNRVKALKACPQRRGVCMKMVIMTPKKPNSAKRKVAWIRLSTKKNIFGYIPGEGHNLQKFSHVLLRGGLIRDLPGVHYTIIRGKLDLKGIIVRRQGRSKYGTKIWWKAKKRDRLSAKAKYKKEIQSIINYKQKKKKLFRIQIKNFRVMLLDSFIAAKKKQLQFKNRK